ncbi:MAG: TRL-like family protein [Candidatus Kapabacteria bacterium]|nr:TRL-like family protein [Candidatus Kapabacteria bacterium]MBX7153768.1 TRL-like family protein [Bacteroidota bacterium]
MKRYIQMFAAVAVVAISLSACSMTVPVCATSNPVGSKVGEASGTGYLHGINLGVDASIRTAAKNGGISKISTVDFKMTDMLGLIQTYTCIVSGE